jgi:hypothetical protein
MSLAQMQCENPTGLDLDGFEDVWLDFQQGSITDQSSITVDYHHAGVLGPGHQHPQLAAGSADRRQHCHFQIARDALFGLGQPSTRHLLLENWCFLRPGLCRVGSGQ